jgi:hypothetical protein
MPEAPRGTVTFLFSDIEHSTRLLQHLGERYAEVLAAYREGRAAVLIEQSVTLFRSSGASRRSRLRSASLGPSPTRKAITGRRQHF